MHPDVVTAATIREQKIAAFDGQLPLGVSESRIWLLPDIYSNQHAISHAERARVKCKKYDKCNQPLHPHGTSRTLLSLCNLRLLVSAQLFKKRPQLPTDICAVNTAVQHMTNDSTQSKHTHPFFVRKRLALSCLLNLSAHVHSCTRCEFVSGQNNRDAS